MAFAVNTCLLFFSLAGSLALTPPAVQRMFGPRSGAVIYGCMYSAFAVASIFGGTLTKAMVSTLGYAAVFKIMAVMSLVAAAMVQWLKPLPSYKESAV